MMAEAASPYFGTVSPRTWYGSRVLRALEADNWEWLAGWLSGEFAIDVTGAEVESFVTGMFGRVVPGELVGWSDASWRMWFKKRLESANKFPCGCRSERERPIDLRTPLHVFFVGIAETPEQLARLAHDDFPEYDRPDAPKLAQPGLAHTIYRPAPIDATAARVVNLHTQPRSDT